MKRKLVAGLLAVGVMALFCDTASAQAPNPGRYQRPLYGPGYRPQLSPYLNLLRGGDPAANFFLGTVPEQQRRQQAQQFGNEIAALDETVNRPALAPQDQDLLAQRLTSGHPTAANTTLGYYNDTRAYYPQPQVPGVRGGATAYQPRTAPPRVR